MLFEKQISFPSHIMFQHFDDEAVLLDIQTQEHYGLNPVGALFVNMLQEGKSLQETYTLILQEFDVGPQQLEQDLLMLINELKSHHLIELT